MENHIDIWSYLPWHRIWNMIMNLLNCPFLKNWLQCAMHILFFVPRDSRNNWSRFGWDQYIIITYITAVRSNMYGVCKWALLRRLHTLEFGCIIVRSLPNLKWAHGGLEIDKYCKSTTWMSGSTIFIPMETSYFLTFFPNLQANKDFFFKKWL